MKKLNLPGKVDWESKELVQTRGNPYWNPTPCIELDGHARGREARQGRTKSIYGVDRCLNDNIDGVNSAYKMQSERVKTK